MKMSKIFLFAVLGSFSLPVMASDTVAEKEPKKIEKKKLKKHYGHKKHDHLYCNVPVVSKVAAITSAAEKPVPAAPVLNAKKDDSLKGYVKVTDNTFIGMHGFVKAVFNSDFSGFGGDKLQTNNIPFSQSEPKRKFTVQGKASRLGFDSLTKTSSGDIKGKLELDFWGNAAKAGTDDSTSSYAPRVRHGFVTFNGFTIGHTDSLFVTYPTTPAVDTEGHFGGPLRQLQIRYTTSNSGPVICAVALERSGFDMLTNAGRTYASTAALPTGVERVTRLPDLTSKVGFKFGDHALAVRSLVRKMEFKDTTNNKNISKIGWAVGADAKLSTMKNSYFVAVANYGAGFGRYIAELEGQSIVTQVVVGQINTDVPKMFEWGLGYTQGITDAWQLNVGYSQATCQKSALLTDAATQKVSGQLQRVYTNVMWNPIKELTISLEYAQGLRHSFKNAVGTESVGIVRRVVVGVQYNF